MILDSRWKLPALAGALALAACGGNSGTSTYALGGSVTGLAAGQEVTLDLDAGAPLVLAANGAFTLATPVAAGSSYAVTLGAQPVAQQCTLAGGSGVMPAADANGIAVTCAPPMQRTIYAPPGNAGGDGQGGLTVDAQGKLYGATSAGGSNYSGAVFKLAPGASGAYVATVLYNFTGGADGGDPVGGMLVDAAGNIYGTAQLGGGNNVGTLFMLAPDGSGGYTQSVLHSFTGGADGSYPNPGLIADTSGTIYGTVSYGGSGNGTVFALTHSGSGFTMSILYTFAGGNDGRRPFGGLVRDAAGNLYGTTSAGGASNAGTVFRLAPSGSGYVESVLYTFTGGADGAYPNGSLAMDAAGNLYGSTVAGGVAGGGTVFKLAPKTGGGYAQTVLHSFAGGTDGNNPYCSVYVDAGGSLYGTTISGGASYSGTVFRLVPGTGGSYTQNVLYSFTGGTDGGQPYAGVVADAAGNIWGLDTVGGASNVGAVFEIY